MDKPASMDYINPVVQVLPWCWWLFSLPILLVNDLGCTSPYLSPHTDILITLYLLLPCTGPHINVISLTEDMKCFPCLLGHSLSIGLTFRVYYTNGTFTRFTEVLLLDECVIIGLSCSYLLPFVLY